MLYGTRLQFDTLKKYYCKTLHSINAVSSTVRIQKKMDLKNKKYLKKN